MISSSAVKLNANHYLSEILTDSPGHCMSILSRRLDQVINFVFGDKKHNVAYLQQLYNHRRAEDEAAVSCGGA